MSLSGVELRKSDILSGMKIAFYADDASEFVRKYGKHGRRDLLGAVRTATLTMSSEYAPISVSSVKLVSRFAQ
jgi:hypothetical protein